MSDKSLKPTIASIVIGIITFCFATGIAVLLAGMIRTAGDESRFNQCVHKGHSENYCYRRIYTWRD